jgi:hypothetical protein
MWRLRAGLLAPPAAAAAFLVGAVLRGALPDAGEPGFAAAVHGPGFDVWTSAVMNGLVWLIFGAVAIHQVLPAGPARFYAAAFTVAGAAVQLPLIGAMRLAWRMSDDPAGLASATMADATWVLWLWFQRCCFVAAGVALWLASGQHGAGPQRWPIRLTGLGVALLALQVGGENWALIAAAAVLLAGSTWLCLANWQRPTPQRPPA